MNLVGELDPFRKKELVSRQSEDQLEQSIRIGECFREACSNETVIQIPTARLELTVLGVWHVMCSVGTIGNEPDVKIIYELGIRQSNSDESCNAEVARTRTLYFHRQTSVRNVTICSEPAFGCSGGMLHQFAMDAASP